MAVSMEQLDTLDHDIEELKKNYEAYFQGIARVPPEKDFAKIQTSLRRLKEEWTVNTAVKFRLSSLVSKFQSYSRYWGRIMKEIEEGRYHRDRFKADLHARERGMSPAAGQQGAARAAGADDENLAALHKEYMMARLECNQSIEGLSKRQLEDSIKKSLPSLQKRYPDKKIEFKVVVENGKAKLKAIPR